MSIPSDFLHGVPEILRESVVRWWERVGRDGTLPGIHASLPGALQAELPRVVAASEFAASALIQDPEALGWVARASRAVDRRARRTPSTTRRVAAAATTAEAQRVLREWRRREMLRIAWRDIAGRAGRGDTLRALSELADGCIRAAAQRPRSASARHPFGRPAKRGRRGSAADRARHGQARRPGAEFLLRHRSRASCSRRPARPTARARSTTRSISTASAAKLIRLLDARTEEGFVFRVDMRLRPFGESGPLVVSLASLEDYLQQHGRDWERYAWIKARAIVGGEAYARGEPGIRAAVRLSALPRFRRVRIAARDEGADRARSGAPRSRARPEARGRAASARSSSSCSRCSWCAAAATGGCKMRRCSTCCRCWPARRSLSAEEVAELHEAYLVLRKAENAVQMIRDEQAASMPSDPADRARLCLNMGVPPTGPRRARASTPRAAPWRGSSRRCCSAARTRSGANGEAPLSWLGIEAIDVARGTGRAADFPRPRSRRSRRCWKPIAHAAPYRRLDEAGRRRAARDPAIAC